jgi:hypothetical protein
MRGVRQGELNSLAHSLCRYVLSRNNDIGGYWGLGVLCAAAQRIPVPMFRFRIPPGQVIRVGGHDLSQSAHVTGKLVRFGLDSIVGELRFEEVGRYPHGAKMFLATIAIAVAQRGRVGIGLMHSVCWIHDPARESQSLRASDPR